MTTPVTAPSPARVAPPGKSSLRERLSRPWLVELTWTAATMLVALVAAAWVLQLWKARLHVPINSGGDALLNLSVFKGLIQHGWYFHNPSLGAPGGQELLDYSGFDGDNLQFFVLRILALGTSDPAALLNFYYVLGYPMVAGTTFLVLRHLGISRPSALVGAVLFALLPYHFVRGEGHLFLGQYYPVSLGGWLVLRTLMGHTILPRRSGVPGLRGRLSLVAVATVVACVAAGGSTLYYGVFTILLLGAAAIVRLISTRSVRSMLPGLVLAFVVGLVLLADIAPALIYTHQHGHDPAVAARLPAESEIYGGSLTQMLLPFPNSRVAALSKLGAKYTAGAVVKSEGGQQIGIFLGLSLVGLLALLGARTLRASRDPAQTTLAAAAAVAAFLAFLFFTYDGFSGVIAYVVSPQIRAWNRLTPYVAFFAAVGLVVALDALWVRARVRRAGRVLMPVALLVVLVAGVLDQTSVNFRPAYGATLTRWRSDARFVASVEAALPRNAMVVQLPLHPFPETTGDNIMADYDEFNGYVHSQHLRWSYGAMKGRAADWTSAAVSRPLEQVIPQTLAAGFSAVYIDRDGYADGGAAIEAKVRKILGVKAPLVSSADGRLVLYDGRPAAQRLARTLSPERMRALGDTLTHPLGVGLGAGFNPVETKGGTSWNWIASDAVMTVHNTGAPRQLVLSARARAAAGAVLTIRIPGQAPHTYNFVNGEQPVRLPFALAAGATITITMHDTAREQGQTAADPRDLRVQLVDFAVGDDLSATP